LKWKCNEDCWMGDNGPECSMVAYQNTYDNPNCEGPLESVPIDDVGDGSAQGFCESDRTCDFSTFTMAEGSLMSAGVGCGSYEWEVNMAVGECIGLMSALSVTTECTGEAFVYKYYKSDDCTGTVLIERGVSTEFRDDAGQPLYADECLMMEQCGGNTDDALTVPAALDSLLNGDIARKEQPMNDATWTETLDSLEAHGGLLTVMALLVLGVFCVCCVGCAWFMRNAGTGYGPAKQAYIDEEEVEVFPVN